MIQLEEQTRLTRKELLKQLKTFKKQYPEGITREFFADVASTLTQNHTDDEEFIGRLFNAFDVDHSGLIDFREFILALTMISSDLSEDKIRFCFRSLDLDNSGSLDREELFYAVNLIFKNNPDVVNRVPEDINTPEKVVDKVFTTIDLNHDSKITCEELLDCLSQHPKMFSYLGLNIVFNTK